MQEAERENKVICLLFPKVPIHWNVQAAAKRAGRSVEICTSTAASNDTHGTGSGMMRWEE